MNNKKQILLAIVSLVIFTSLLVAFLVSQSQLKETKKEERGEREPTTEIIPSSTVPPVPTLTEEEKEVIREIETHEVRIIDKGFEPESLTVKLHDQVDWVNETQTSCKIKGEDWGGVEIRPGKRFTQSFEKMGVYSYSCQLQPETTGEIIVE